MDIFNWWRTTKYRRLLTIIGVGTLLALLLSLAFPRPKPPGQPTAGPAKPGTSLPAPSLGSVVPTANLPVTLNNQTVPVSEAVTSLKVYEAATGSASLVEGQRWAALFGFTKAPEKEGSDTYLWLSDGYHMFRYNLKNNGFEYYAQPKTAPANPILTDFAGYQDLAVKTLIADQLYKEPKDFEILKYNFLRRKGSEYSYVPELSLADEVLFYVRPVLNGLPVVAAEQETTPTLLDLDKYGVVRQLVHHPWAGGLKEKGTYNLKSTAEAAKEVMAGKGAIVSVSGIGYEVPKLTVVSVSRVYTAYLYPKLGETLVQPVYVFTGQASDANSRQVADVTIMLWAIGR